MNSYRSPSEILLLLATSGYAPSEDLYPNYQRELRTYMLGAQSRIPLLAPMNGRSGTRYGRFDTVVFSSGLKVVPVVI